MNITELLKEAAQLLNIRELELEENKEVSLSFDNIVVTVQTSTDEILLLTRLADAPSFIRMNEAEYENLYKFLLEISHFGALDVYIGLDTLQSCFTCTSKLFLYALDAQKFISHLQKHVNTAEMLRDAIQNKDTIFEEAKPLFEFTMLKV